MSSAEHFLELIQKSKRGKFKIYIGMSAGVGKTYRMLQEAHSLLKHGVDIKIGYIEPHLRAETIALVAGIPAIPRKSIFYKGKYLEEMDVRAIINDHPEIVIVDELAHTNVEGSANKKRWQDVFSLLLMQARNFSGRELTDFVTSVSTFFSTCVATSFKANSRNCKI